MRVSIFCAASPGIDSVYFDAAETLALELVRHKIEVVYGGGAIGLMGILADTVIRQGGEIQGIIAKFMYDRGWAHPKVSKLVVTNNMADRKMRYLDNVDAVIGLPGGTGTLEEILDAISLKSLGLFDKPIIILNTNGYYDPLSEMLDRGIRQKFIDPDNGTKWIFATNPEDVIKHLGLI